MKDETKYMNINTGSVDAFDGWWYENEDGEMVNGVNLGEVVEIEKYELQNCDYFNDENTSGYDDKDIRNLNQKLKTAWCGEGCLKTLKEKILTAYDNERINKNDKK